MFELKSLNMKAKFAGYLTSEKLGKGTNFKINQDKQCNGHLKSTKNFNMSIFKMTHQAL